MEEESTTTAQSTFSQPSNIEQLNYFQIDFTPIHYEEEQYFAARVTSCKTLPLPKMKTILLVIDKSGSMNGENIKHTKIVLKQFLNYFKNALQDASVNLITFDTSQNLIKDLNKEDWPKIEKIVENIPAGGGTYFAGIFSTISDFIKNRKMIEDLSIIFMTDGRIEYDSDLKNNFANITEKLEALSQTIKTRVGQLDIHALGLGKGHDPFLLEKLINIKKEGSSFLFIINETGINPSFNAVKDMIVSNRIQGEIVLIDINAKETRIPLILTELEATNVLLSNSREWESLVKNTTPIDIEAVNLDESYLEIKITNGMVKEKFTIKDYYLKNKDKIESVYRVSLLKIKERLNQILSTLKKLVKDNNYNFTALDKCKEEKVQINKEYQSVGRKIFRIHEQKSKNYLFQQCEDIGPLIKVIEDLLTGGYKQKVKSEILGQAIQLSHKNIKKKKYINELESKLPTIMRLFNKQDVTLKELSLNINLIKMTKAYPKQMFEEFKCYLTGNDFAESLLEQDCLCITFSIIRTATTAFNPGLVKINNIFAPLISAQSYLNSNKYGINLNFSGEMDKEEEITTNGNEPEIMNAALPIFICKEHWQFSQLLIDRLLGWIVTLEPMGYHISQKLTIPFILMEKIFEENYLNPQKDFNQHYLRLVTDTCLHLMIFENEKEDSNFKVNILKLYNSYTQYGTVRTPDSISKSSLFFIKLYCHVVLGWLTDFEKIKEIYYLLIEENLRRIQPKLYSSFQDYEPMSLSKLTDDIEKEKTINKYCEEYINLYFTKCKLLRVIRFRIFNCNKWDETLYSFEGINAQLPETKEVFYNETGIEGPLNLYAMLFQNQIHHEDAVRKKFYTDNLYVDTRKNPKEVFELFDQKLAEIQKKREKQTLSNAQMIANLDVNNFRRKFRNLEVIQLLMEYSKCEDMSIAQNLLEQAMTIKSGKGVHYYFSIFFSLNSIPFLYKKLKLLGDKHEGFRRSIKLKHTYQLCYSGLLSNDQLIEVLGLKAVPKSVRREHKCNK